MLTQYSYEVEMGYTRKNSLEDTITACEEKNLYEKWGRTGDAVSEARMQEALKSGVLDNDGAMEWVNCINFLDEFQNLIPEIANMLRKEEEAKAVAEMLCE